MQSSAEIEQIASVPVNENVYCHTATQYGPVPPDCCTETVASARAPPSVVISEVNAVVVVASTVTPPSRASHEKYPTVLCVIYRATYSSPSSTMITSAGKIPQDESSRLVFRPWTISSTETTCFP